MQILTLAKQMYPGQNDFFLNQYEEAVRVVACTNHSLQSYFFQKEFFCELIFSGTSIWVLQIFFNVILSDFSKLSLSFETKT